MALVFKRHAMLHVLMCVLLTIDLAASALPSYTYKRYPYKKKQRSERKIRVARALCEENVSCEQKYGLERLSCVRQCMSAECYAEIYAHDELEEGEIDVRINSFKGCVLQRSPDH